MSHHIYMYVKSENLKKWIQEDSWDKIHETHRTIHFIKSYKNEDILESEV